MSIVQQILAGRLTTATAKLTSGGSVGWGLLLGSAVFVVILALPQIAGLPTAGQRMLAVLGFAVVVWVTEALDYAISAIVISALMAFLLGLSPDPAKPQTLIGTVQGLTTAMSGFANTALTLVAAAL